MKSRILFLVGLLGAAVIAWAQPSNDSLNMRRLAWYPVTQWGPVGPCSFFQKGAWVLR